MDQGHDLGRLTFRTITAPCGPDGGKRIRLVKGTIGDQDGFGQHDLFIEVQPTVLVTHCLKVGRADDTGQGLRG